MPGPEQSTDQGVDRRRRPHLLSEYGSDPRRGRVRLQRGGQRCSGGERLEAGDVAAVLCDLRMPGESGLEFLATLIADFPDVAVVVTTAWTTLPQQPWHSR